jgi:TRAP-type mannitol/chloroaromatic compound transport system permease small subunit
VNLISIIPPSIRFLSRINRLMGKFSATLTLGLVLLVFINVVLRYLFNLSEVSLKELEWHIFGALFLLGAGYTLQADGHVRVDVFYQHLSDSKKAWVNLLGCLILLVPGAALLISTGYEFAHDSFKLMETSPDPGGLPYRFIIKSMIPLGFFFLLLQSLALILQSIETLISKKSPSSETEAL